MWLESPRITWQWKSLFQQCLFTAMQLCMVRLWKKFLYYFSVIPEWIWAHWTSKFHHIIALWSIAFATLNPFLCLFYFYFILIAGHDTVSLLSYITNKLLIFALPLPIWSKSVQIATFNDTLILPIIILVSALESHRPKIWKLWYTPCWGSAECYRSVPCWAHCWQFITYRN